MYAGAATLATPVLRRMLRRRVARGKEIAARLPERFGIDAVPRPDGRLLWLHAASVGETRSVLPVLAAFARAAPTATVLMTTGSVTSASLLASAVAEMKLEGHVLHRFVPLDVPAWAARFVNHWQPDAAAFVESEIWPNLIGACTDRRIPLMLLNGRVSPRSFARWRRLPALARSLFGAFDRVHPQSDGDAERLRALGARNVGLGANLKFAAAPLAAPRIELERLRRLIAGRPVWLAAVTHPGEEAIAVAVHAALAARYPRLLTIIVPRHPARGAEVAALVGSLPVRRRAAQEDPPDEEGFWIGDTLGELGLFYRLVGHAFVGGSFVPMGGQNPLEAARLGCAVAIGPRTENQRDAVAALAVAGALTEVRDAAALTDWVELMLTDVARRRAMGEAGVAASRRFADLPQLLAAMLVELLSLGRQVR